MKQIVFEESCNGITIDRVIRDHEYSMPTKHYHEEYEIYYLLEGERYYFIEQQTYYVKKGSLVFVNRNKIHKTGQAGNSYHDRILIEIKEEPFSSFFSSFGNLAFSDFFHTHCGLMQLDQAGQQYVEKLLFSMIEELRKQSIGYELTIMMTLAQLLIYALRCHTESTLIVSPTKVTTAKHQKVDEVASYIIKHCTSSLTLDSLAKRFYVSKCYLSRIFKEVTGFTINEYIAIHRLQKAQYLLIHSDYNISKIAELLGYESITYFDRVFKNYMELSPLKYRKHYKP